MRKKHEMAGPEKARRKFRQKSTRHVLCLEAQMSQEQKAFIFSVSEKVRKASNELTGMMGKHLHALIDIKKYRGLCKALAKSTVQEQEQEEETGIPKALNELKEHHGVTWEACRKLMIPIAKKYGLPQLRD